MAEPIRENGWYRITPVVVYTGPDGKPRSAYESHRAQWVATGDRMWLDRMVAAVAEEPC